MKNKRRNLIVWYTDQNAIIHANIILRKSTEKIQYSEDTVGYWNLGYVDTQVKYNGRHVQSAAADCYNHVRTCYQLADKYDDDFFFKANAGIEAAMTLVHGAIMG